MILPPTTLALIGVAVIYLLVMNFLTYRVFREDKRRALQGEWRIPEGQLLLAALLGGVIGGRLAMVRFRHKTRKQPFRGLMRAIGLLHYGTAVVALYVLVAPVFSTHVAGLFATTFAENAPRAAQTAGDHVVVNRGLR